MASRRGVHVAGTDGGDYQHRERVAAQYSVSASNKTRLKVLVLSHHLLGAAHLVRLLPSLVTLLGLGVTLPLPPTPPPLSLEYAWLLSLPTPLLAMSASRKSQPGPLRLFQGVVASCCLAPAALTVFYHSSALLGLLQSGLTPGPDELAVLGLPFPLVWSGVLLLCCAVHTAEILVCRTLIRAWQPRAAKRH